MQLERPLHPYEFINQAPGYSPTRQHDISITAACLHSANATFVCWGRGDKSGAQFILILFTLKTTGLLFTEGSQNRDCTSDTNHKVYSSAPVQAAVSNSLRWSLCLPRKQCHVLSRDMSGEGRTQNNISRRVTGSLVARSQSDNYLQAGATHVGKHMGPWAASKRHSCFLLIR